MAGKFKCTICGYIHLGESVPDRCKICNAESVKFIDIPFTASESESEYFDEQAPVIELINLDVLKDVDWDYEIGAFTVNINEIEPGESLEIYSLERDTLFFVLSGDGLVTSEIDIFRTVEIAENPDPDLFDSEEEDEDDENEDIDLESEEEEEIEESDEDCESEESEESEPISYEISPKDIFVLPVDENLFITNTGDENLVVIVIG